MINLLGTFTPKFEINVPLLTFPVFASQELQAKETPDANREALNCKKKKKKRTRKKLLRAKATAKAEERRLAAAKAEVKRLTAATRAVEKRLADGAKKKEGEG